MNEKSGVKVPTTNIVIISGRLGRVPELNYTRNSTAVLNVSIAHSDRVKINGEWTDKTVWFDCTVWGAQAERAAETLYKGAPVIIQGRLDFDEWDDRTTGKKRTKLKVSAISMQCLEWSDKTSTHGKWCDNANPSRNEIDDSDIPF